MKNITFSAVMATNLLNVLKGYTKGIRFVAVLTLLLTMGIGQAWGANTGHTINYPYFYYYNDASWSNVSVIFGRSWTNDNYTKAGPMTLVPNTEKLYFRYIEDNWNSEYNQIAVLHGSWAWPSGENKNIESRWDYATNKQHTDNVVWNHDMKYQEVHYWGGKSANSISREVPKYTTTLNIKVKESGQATYSNATLSDKPASTIKLTGTYLSSAGETTRSAASWTTNSSCEYESVISGKVTPAYEGLNTDWTFDGWYVNSTKISSDKNYDFYQTANTTIEARFTKTVKYTVTWKVNGEEVKTESVAYSSKVTTLPTAPTIDCNGKVFVGWSNQEVTDGQKPSVLFTSASNAPAVTGATTYHAVFATEAAEAIDPIIFANQGWENSTELSSHNFYDGLINFTFEKNNGTNAPKYYNTGSAIRLYYNNKMTIKSTSDEIQTVTFHFVTQEANGNSITADTGEKMDKTPTNASIESLTHTWTVNSSSVVFTIGSYFDNSGTEQLKGHCKISRIDIVTEDNNSVTYSNYTTYCIPIYTITYDLNGGSGSCAEAEVEKGSDYTICATPPTKEGYIFQGWEYNGTTYREGATISNIQSDITLVAQWNPITYSIVFDANGGTGTMSNQNFTYGTAQNLTANTFTRTGYSFAGWNTVANGSGTSYDDEEDVKNLTTENGATITFYAQWFELVVTQLQWSEDYYTATMEADNDFPDLTILPNDFAGVLTYQSSNPAVATIAADGTITLIGTGTTTITASIAADDTYLAASDSYELTVAASNCRWVEVTDNTTLEDGDEVVIAMTKGNYVWTISNENHTSSTAPTTVDISANVEGQYLTTVNDGNKWVIEKNNDNLTFYSYNDNANYLYCINDDNGVRVGTGTAKVFVVDGNYLKNTQTNSSRYIGVSLNTTPYSWRCYTVTTGVIKDQTLKFYKRVCLDSEHYWLTWDATDGQFADGTKQIMKDYAVGTTINKPFDPTRTGYEFAGWSTDGVNVVTPADNMPEENLSYSAVWQIKSYTVTWDADGGQFADGKTVIEQTYEYGATITKPADPTRTGYTFKGWSPNVPDKMSTDNLKFVAQWQVNQYTVTWNPGEGGHWGDSFVPIVEKYNYGAPINKPTNPEKAGYVFNKWEPDVVATMPNNHLTYTAKWNEAFCDAYTFHTGNENVWNDPQEQICFEFKANHEWQIINYVIPTSDKQSHFLVAYKGWPQIDQGSLGGLSKSVTREWYETMYLAPSMDSNDGNGSPKVGHAKGAVGTLRIFDNSNWENLYVGFIPNGYKLKFGANEYDFIHHEDAEYRSEIVEYNATTANNNVSVGVINTSNAYVETLHTQEGMRHIFLKVNDEWKQKGAKFAIYYWDNKGNGWSKFMKSVPGETDLYEGWIPTTYTNFKFVRLNSSAENPNWDSKWNETSDLTLHADKTLYSIPFGSWDGAADNNWSPYQRKGRFRIYNNSWDKNWYVHFYPHYVVTFDKNAADAEGSMPPQALPLDANPMTIELNQCGFDRKGYDFTGWKTDLAITADGANVAADGNVKDGATITNIDKDITLTAQWKAQAYTIIYKDQGDVAYSGENEASLPQTHTYDQMTTLVAGVKTGYTFGGWYTTPECVGTAVTELGAQDYTADITLYAKWTFAMEYNITNTETIFITSAKGQKIKAPTPIVLSVNNMPVGTKVAISAPNITFYDEVGNVVTDLTTNFISESFSLSAAYTPTEANITEQPTITLSVLGNEKTIEGLISARSLPATFAIVAKVGNMWYALPSQGLNSTTPPAAYPIEVDNMTDPTAVTEVPVNADWSLRQVYEAIRDDATKDRYAENGHNLVFVNNASPAMTLNASSSEEENYLLTDAQYANYYETNPGLYEWTPTTTDLETYQLTNERRSRTLSVNTATVFGVHAQNKAVEQVRFLPITGRYTPAALQVVEWKENSVVIMYNGDPAQTASVSVNGADAQNTTLSAAQCDIAVYELAADGLAVNPTQRLSITIGTEKVILSIPYIISGSKNDKDVLPGRTVAARQEVAKVSDLVILKDATLTADGAKGNPYKFRNVTIYGGGKLVIPSDKGFGVSTLTLRIGGVTEEGNYDYVYPEFELNINYDKAFTNTSAVINLDYVTTKSQYYTFVAPFAVETKDIKYPVDVYGSNVEAANRGSFEFQYYDGAARAAGEKGWKVVEEDPTDGATLTAHQGYTFYGMPKKVSVNGGTSTRQKFGIHRIPMSVTAANVMTHENTDQTTMVSAYPSQHNINAGWNLIGNPYMSTITGLNNESIQTGTIVLVDDRWQWSAEGTQANRFIVFPSNDGEWYYTSQATNAELPAFKNFFVQIGNENATDLSIPRNTSQAQLLAPIRHTDEEVEHDIEMAIVLEKDEAHSDQMDFLINDAYGAGFDYNADFTKMMNNTQLNLYGVLMEDNLSFVALDHFTARSSIAIGYQVPSAGEYTLRISDKPYVMLDRIEALYVTDHEMNPAVTTNLMEEDYVFHVGKAEINDTRFTISLSAKANNDGDDVTTDMGEVDIHNDLPQKFFYDGKLYILREGKVYSATGHEIKTINK